MKRNGNTINVEPRKIEAVRRKGELMRAAALPETSSVKYPRVTLLADRHIEVENHCGVLEIRRDAIRLKTALGVLRIEGDMLEIRSAEALNALIDGRISSVCYENAP